ESPRGRHYPFLTGELRSPAGLFEVARVARAPVGTREPSASLSTLTGTMSSFVRGIFAGALHDELLFPYPPPLDKRDPDEARVVRRLIDDLREMQRSGLIDSARFDEQESIDEEVVRALARTGFLG